MSVVLAERLGIVVKESEVRAFETASAVDELPVQGKADVELRWRDENGTGRGEKVSVHVVFGLHESTSVILAFKFTDDHPNVWKFAQRIVTAAARLNPMFWDPFEREQEKYRAELAKKAYKVNKALADAEDRAVRDKIEARTGSNNLGSTSSGSSSTMNTT